MDKFFALTRSPSKSTVSFCSHPAETSNDVLAWHYRPALAEMGIKSAKAARFQFNTVAPDWQPSSGPAVTRVTGEVIP
jgi:hypothetical protein